MEEVEVYGFCGFYWQNKENVRNGRKIEIDGNREILDTYRKETEEWLESQMKFEKLKDGVNKQIELSNGCDWIREKLKEWVAYKDWDSRRKGKNQTGIEEQLPIIPEWGRGGDFNKWRFFGEGRRTSSG